MMALVSVIVLLSPIWIGTYLALGRPLSAAIPAAGGLQPEGPPHALAAARMALEIGPALRAGVGDEWPDLRVRVGIASGPLIAGVIGRRRFSYDLWGDTVNTASRMAALAQPGSVEITGATAALLGDDAVTERQEAVEVKGKGRMTAYRLLAIKPTGHPPP